MAVLNNRYGALSLLKNPRDSFALVYVAEVLMKGIVHSLCREKYRWDLGNYKPGMSKDRQRKEDKFYIHFHMNCFAYIFC